jgi:putative sigma-54 modulation protein
VAGVASDATRRKEADVRIEVRGKNVELTDELREAVIQRFQRVGRQVSEFATLEVELCEEKNPRIADRMVAEATLGLKGVTLRAKEASPDMLHSIHELAEDIRRQVKKHRDKRRKRHTTRKLMQRQRGATA